MMISVQKLHALQRERPDDSHVHDVRTRKQNPFTTTQRTYKKDPVVYPRIFRR